MENYVKQFRKIISNNIDTTGQIGVVLDYNLDYCPNINKVRTLLIETITFMDLYKRLNYKKVTSALTENDLLLLPVIDSVVKVKEIHEMILNNPNTLKALLEASYNFHKATILEKISQIKALNREERNFLLELTPCFQEDLDTYDGNIKIETFYNYYKNLHKFYMDNKMPFMMESVIDQIVGFLKNLHHYDEENFIQIVLSLSIIDYKYASYFLKTDEYPKIANGERKAMSRINLFEEGGEKDILDHALLDDYYLYELLDMYLMTRNLHPEEEMYELEYRQIDTKAKQKVKTIEERIKRYER